MADGGTIRLKYLASTFYVVDYDRIAGDIHRRHGMPCSDVVDPCAVVCVDINHPVPELCVQELSLSYFNVRATLP